MFHRHSMISFAAGLTVLLAAAQLHAQPGRRPGGGDSGRRPSGFDRGRDSGGRPGGSDRGRDSRGRPSGFSRGGDSGGDRSSFITQMMMQRYDQNKDGRIDTKEAANSRMPLVDMMKKRGLTSLSAGDLGKVFQQMREERESQQRRDSEQRRDDGRRDDGRRDDSRRDSRGRTPAKPQSKRIKKEKQRVNLELPEDYKEGDTDEDGQIGLYEWRKWKGRGPFESIEFAGLDLNGDGFVTPKEIVTIKKKEDAKTSSTASRSSSRGDSRGSSGGTQPQGNRTFRITGQSGNSGSRFSFGRGATDPSAAARTTFGYLDRDKDGNLSKEEWAASQRTRQSFEKAGITVRGGMSQDAFIKEYVRLKSGQGGR